MDTYADDLSVYPGAPHGLAMLPAWENDSTPICSHPQELAGRPRHLFMDPGIRQRGPDRGLARVPGQAKAVRAVGEHVYGVRERRWLRAPRRGGRCVRGVFGIPAAGQDDHVRASALATYVHWVLTCRGDRPALDL
jgi:hypothetical protein